METQTPALQGVVQDAQAVTPTRAKAAKAKKKLLRRTDRDYSQLVRRSYQAACIDCAKCAKVCPSNLPVDQLITIKSAECTGCLECVAICPAEGALHLALPQIPKPYRQGSKAPRRTRRIPARVMAAGVAVLLFGIVGYAKAVGLWDSHIPAAVYRQLVPHANAARHPMPGDQPSE
jgi:ferredoxin